MTARNGFNLGSSVIHRLRNMHHFTVERNDDWDTNNNIDFIVFYIPNLQRIQSIGVQMTPKLDDTGNMQDFLEGNSNESKLVDRILYIEVDPTLQLDGAGGDLVAFVIRQVQQDRAWQNVDTAGARLFGNMTYELFNLREQTGRGRSGGVSAGAGAPAAASTGSGSAPAQTGDTSELVRALQHRRTQIAG